MSKRFVLDEVVDSFAGDDRCDPFGVTRAEALRVDCDCRKPRPGMVRQAQRDRARAGRAVPVMVQVTVETTGRLLVGSEIGAALTSLGALKPDVFGMNCATGPAEMQEHLRYLSQHSPIPISVLPNAGLPQVVNGQPHFPLTPAELARLVLPHGTTAMGRAYLFALGEDEREALLRRIRLQWPRSEWRGVRARIDVRLLGHARHRHPCLL